MRTSEQTSTLIAALVTARGGFDPIHKNAKGQVGKDRPYPYADLAAVLDAVVPELLRRGLLILQSIDAETSSLITRLAHTSGEWVESVYPLPTTADARAFGSALTYGRRYSIQSLLCLTAADDDAQAARIPHKPHTTAKVDTGKAKTITGAQQKKLFTIAEQAGWSHRQIRDYLTSTVGVEHSKDIPAALFDELCADFDVPPDEAETDPA